LRIGWFDLYDLLFDDYGLFFGRLEIPRRVGFGSQALDSIKHLFLICQKRIADSLRPVELFAHHGEHLRKIHQRFYARVPVLFLKSGSERVTLKTGVLSCPAFGQRDFQGIGRSHQDLRYQRVRVQRDRR
jgi:hypothetical protein